MQHILKFCEYFEDQIKNVTYSVFNEFQRF